jgi:hypothetical protein
MTILDQGVIHFDAQVSDSAFNLGMSKQKLNGPQVFGPPIDQSGLCASQRMGPKQPRIQSSALDPFRNKACILAGEQKLAGLFVGGV